jgi:hypothetical protein
VQALKDIYFKDSYIDGVDISTSMISTCKKLNLGNKINFYSSDEFKGNGYDIVFCMSVLCRWPQTRDLVDCSKEYTFNQFESQLLELDEMVNAGGLLVVYNANFLFTDTILNDKYTPLVSEKIDNSGFVKKFDKLNKEFLENYPYSIFIKK